MNYTQHQQDQYNNYFSYNNSYNNINNNNNNNNNISYEKILTPKTNYNFDKDKDKKGIINKMKNNRTQSRNSSKDSSYLNSLNSQKPQNYKTLKNAVNLSKEKIRSKNSSFEKNKNLNPANSQTSVNEYLQRRHFESQEKLNQIKNNKFRDEVKELKDRPSISNNSKKIAENIGNKNMNVFDRLTSNIHNNKKEMEIKKLDEIYNHNSNKPKVFL